MMKRFLIAAALTLTLAFVSVVGFAPQSAQAQDDMMTHVCDSTLIALLFVAEYDYGFTSMDMDLSTFEKGQYAPLFDAMMTMMMDGEDMGDDMADDMTEEDMGDDMDMMEDMVMLTPGNIEGEDEACTALRAELDAFLYKALTDSMMMMESDN
jgi:hypothetical protein